MIIQTLIVFIDKDAKPEPLELNTLEAIEVAEGIELEGYAGCKFRLAKLNQNEPILKVLVAQDTPNAKQKEYIKDLMPKGIMLALTNKYTYGGTTRTTDIPAKIRSLMNSDTPEETVQGCIEAFDEIAILMTAINDSFKKYLPFNAEKQGYIRHHFPSPVFKATGAELAEDVKIANEQAEADKAMGEAITTENVVDVIEGLHEALTADVEPEEEIKN